MRETRWERLPLLQSLPIARDWLRHETEEGLSETSLDAYSRAVERFLAWCRERRIRPTTATSQQLADYFHELASAGLRGATLRQRRSALRLFYGYVVARGLRADSPALGVNRSELTSLASSDLPESLTPPFVPSEEEWCAVLEAARVEIPRSRLMLAMAYEGALRREELCAIRRGDVDLERRALRVPATGVGGKHERRIPLSPLVSHRCAIYMQDTSRQGMLRGEDQLFRSESPRNRAQPLSIWTWAKVVERIADRAELSRFTTHTPRYLRLTDLAREGRPPSDIARFAGHSRSGLAHPYLKLAEVRPVSSVSSATDRREEQFATILFAEDR